MSLELPQHLTVEQVKEIAAESETMLEFQRSCRIGRNDARRILNKLDERDSVAQGQLLRSNYDDPD